MNNLNKFDFLVLFFILLISGFYFSGLMLAPFHPDESTQIFMSNDVELIAHNIQSILWTPDNTADLRQYYRELDAPLTRYLIGVGRTIFKAPALSSDWNWSLSWDENKRAGALPDFNLLLVSRISTAFLFPFSLILLYSIGKSSGSRLVGLLAVLFMIINGPVLLHTRRAMAESVLIFTELLALWTMLHFKNRPWISVFAVALAFNAKQSNILLFFLGLAVCIFFTRNNIKKALLNVFLYLSLFILITFLLNPFLWKHPLQSVNASIIARQTLVNQQTSAFRSVNPDVVLDTPLKKMLGMIGNLFILSPAVSEIPNYNQALSKDVERYFSNPLHNLSQGLVTGAIVLITSLIGFITACLFLISDFKQKTAPTIFRSPVNAVVFPQYYRLFIITATILTLAYFYFLPLPFQRYYISMIPLLCLLSSTGIKYIVDRFCQLSVK